MHQNTLLNNTNQTLAEKVFDSDEDGQEGEDGGDGDDDDVVYDKFGNVMDKAAAEDAALQELREAARAARAAKVRQGSETNERYPRTSGIRRLQRTRVSSGCGPSCRPQH